VGAGSSLISRSGRGLDLAYTLLAPKMRDAWLAGVPMSFVFPMRILPPSEFSKFDLVVLVVFGVALVTGSLLLLEIALLEVSSIYQH
jgi:hypothetical protein